MRWWWLGLVAFGCTHATAKPRGAERVHEQRARDVFAELIAIDTSEAGDTAKAARAMSDRLTAAGLPKADVHVFETAPHRGNLVARYRGTGRKRPLLVMAHLDVVGAKREDWSTDPFQLVEKDGYFYGRGTMDDKAMAAAAVNALIRFQTERYKPDRDIILVLATDEETGDIEHRGITWLLDKQRALIDAELALNEGGWVGLRDGKPIYNSIQVAERSYQSYFIDVGNRGGHVGLPRKDNAINDLATALGLIAALRFPTEISDVSRKYLETVAAHETAEVAATIRGILAPSPTTTAIERLRDYPIYYAQVHSTCVATQVHAGEDEGALPRHARATVTCMIMPGHTAEEIQRVLEEAVAPTGATVRPVRKEASAGPSPLPADLRAAVTKLTKRFWPEAAVIPVQAIGATDSLYLRNAGIPTFGNSGLAVDLVDWRMHGKDERVGVRAFYDAQQYLYELVKLVAGGK